MLIELTAQVIELLENKSELELEANLNSGLDDHKHRKLNKTNALIAIEIYKKYYNLDVTTPGYIENAQIRAFGT